jgi:DNA-binding ferritin-like protein
MTDMPVKKSRRGRMTADERLEFLVRKQKELADEIKRQQRLLAERKERKRQEALISAGEIVEKFGFLDRLDELAELLSRNAEHPAPRQPAGSAN